MTGRRAEAVAGLRALADLIESRPDLPVPHALSAQDTVLRARDTDAGEWTDAPLAQRLAEGERVARLLGLELGGHDGHRVARLELGGGVQYSVVVQADPEPVEAIDDEPAEVTP